jgi:hypothetical protein
MGLAAKDNILLLQDRTNFYSIGLYFEDSFGLYFEDSLGLGLYFDE